MINIMDKSQALFQIICKEYGIQIVMTPANLRRLYGLNVNMLTIRLHWEKIEPYIMKKVFKLF